MASIRSGALDWRSSSRAPDVLLVSPSGRAARRLRGTLALEVQGAVRFLTQAKTPSNLREHAEFIHAELVEFNLELTSGNSLGLRAFEGHGEVFGIDDAGGRTPALARFAVVKVVGSL